MRSRKPLDRRMQVTARRSPSSPWLRGGLRDALRAADARHGPRRGTPAHWSSPRLASPCARAAGDFICRAANKGLDNREASDLDRLLDRLLRLIVFVMTSKYALIWLLLDHTGVLAKLLTKLPSA